MDPITFASEDVTLTLLVVKRYDELVSRVQIFCQPIAIGLGYQDVDKVIVNPDGDGWINFVASWHGPYQSHDEKCFSFPADMLPQGCEAVLKYLKEARDADQAEKDARKHESDRAADQVAYTRLKALFEPAKESQ